MSIFNAFNNRSQNKHKYIKKIIMSESENNSLALLANLSEETTSTTTTSTTTSTTMEPVGKSITTEEFVTCSPSAACLSSSSSSERLSSSNSRQILPLHPPSNELEEGEIADDDAAVDDGKDDITDILNNMFDMHPPFQIDGNFGFTAGVAELLLQSHEGFLRILPALPKNWQNGEVKGLKARGNIEVDIKWENGRLKSFHLKSKIDKKVKVIYNGIEVELELKKDKIFDADVGYIM